MFMFNLKPIALAVSALLVSLNSTFAQSVLIDFGNADSYRGLNVPNPDSNGNHWNSVWSGAFYENLVDTTGAATTVDFGFDPSLVTGTDSYNGPAGITSVTSLEDDVFFAEFDSAALGDLGGSPEAVFDYYVSSRFQLQQLDPTKTYDLTFFGSHKYNDDNVTRYNVYSDPDFSDLIGTVDLEVGVDNEHNQDMVAGLTGLRPMSENDVLFVEFVGATGGSGYLNALQIESVTPELPDGDYNADGIVDAADYTVWRDGNSPDSSQAGYDLWADNYGAGTSVANAIPEPTSALLLVSCLAGAIRRRS